MSETQGYPDVAAKVKELESNVNRTERDLRLVINHLILIITHLSDYAANEIDAMAVRSRIGSLKDELKKRL
jgi:hypothetical protein